MFGFFEAQIKGSVKGRPIVKKSQPEAIANLKQLKNTAAMNPGVPSQESRMDGLWGPFLHSLSTSKLSHPNKGTLKEEKTCHRVVCCWEGALLAVVFNGNQTDATKTRYLEKDNIRVPSHQLTWNLTLGTRGSWLGPCSFYRGRVPKVRFHVDWWEGMLVFEGTCFGVVLNERPKDFSGHPYLTYTQVSCFLC